jgi:hypothetical protein
LAEDLPSDAIHLKNRMIRIMKIKSILYSPIKRGGSKRDFYFVKLNLILLLQSWDLVWGMFVPKITSIL